MSIEAMSAVFHHSRAKGTAKLVLLGIANHDGDGGAWPSLSTLARYAGVDARQVRRTLRKLEALGELHTDLNGGGIGPEDNPNAPNLYRVLVTCPVSCDRTTQHRTLGDRQGQPALWKTPARPVENPPVTSTPPGPHTLPPPGPHTPRTVH